MMAREPTGVGQRAARVELAAASVPGTAHTMPGRPGWKNNQDSFASATFSGGCCAVICDGCSSGEHSEVGAAMASRGLLRLLTSALRSPGVRPSELRWGDIKTELIEGLVTLARSLGDDQRGAIQDFFLFTTIGFVVTPEDVCFFHIGDGVYGVNGELTTHDRIGGTDREVGSLSQVFAPEFFSHPDRLRRYLAVINRETVVNGRIQAGPLRDDTTLVIARIV